MSTANDLVNSEPRKAGAAAWRMALGVSSVLSIAVIGFSYGFLKGDYLPHQFCFGGDKRLITTNALADAVIGLAYLTISMALLWLSRRSGGKLTFASLFWLFGIFIVSCGAVHFLEILTLWNPLYWLLTAGKLITALASLITALAVIATDLEGKVTSWNPSAERIFGWKQSEILGTIALTAPENRKAELFGLFHRSLKGETIRGHETVRMNRDQTTREGNGAWTFHRVWHRAPVWRAHPRGVAARRWHHVPAVLPGDRGTRNRGACCGERTGQFTGGGKTYDLARGRRDTDPRGHRGISLRRGAPGI